MAEQMLKAVCFVYVFDLETKCNHPINNRANKRKIKFNPNEKKRKKETHNGILFANRLQLCCRHCLQGSNRLSIIEIEICFYFHC